MQTDSRLSRLLFAAQLLVIASLPFHFLISSYAIGLLIIVFMVALVRLPEFRRSILKAFKSNKVAILMVLFFLTYVVSAAIHYNSYTEDSVEPAALEKNYHYSCFHFC